MVRGVDWEISYCETIDVLYTSDTLDMGNTDCVIWLPRLVLPQRFNVIGSLRAAWFATDPPDIGGQRHINRVWRLVARACLDACCK